MNKTRKKVARTTIPLIGLAQQYRLLRNALAVVGVTALLVGASAIALHVKMTTLQQVVIAVIAVFGLFVRLLPPSVGLRRLPQLSLLTWAGYQVVILAFPDFGIDVIYIGVLPVMIVLAVNGSRAGGLAGVGTVAMAWFATYGLNAPWFGTQDHTEQLFALITVSLVFGWFVGTFLVLLRLLQQNSDSRALHRNALALQKREALRSRDMVHMLAVGGRRLLQNADWRFAADDLLAQAGPAVGADRMALLAVEQHPEHGWTLSISHYWQSDEAVQIDWQPDPNIPLRLAEFGLEHWLDDLQTHTPVVITHETADTPTLAALQMFRSTAIVMVPIFREQQQIWGLLAADRVRALPWTDVEQDVLSSLAETFSAAIRRHHAEQQQIEANNRLRAILNAIPDALLTVDLQGNIVDALTMLERNRNMDLANYEGLNIAQFMSPADSARLRAQLGDTYTSGTAHGGHYAVTGLSEEGLVLDIRSSVSGPGETLVVARDITTQHLLELQRRASEVKFRALYENSPDVVALIAGDDLRITDVNPVVETLLGYDRAALLGQHCRVMLRTADATHDESIDVWLQEALTPGVRPSAETLAASKRRQVALFDAHGLPVAVDMSLTPLQFEDEGYVLLLLRDVRHRVRADELDAALALERELHSMQSNFVETVSHQFRTPLTIIQLSAEILHSYGQQLVPAKRERRFRLIAEQIARMETLLDNVLRYSEVADTSQLQYTRIDVWGFLEKLVQNVNATTATPRVMLQIERGVAEIMADPRLLQIIVRNPLDNALAYSTADPVFLTASVQDGGLLLKTADTGPGIPPESLSRIFEPFQRGSNVATTDGSGLGLTTMRRAVLRHQGSVDVQSTLNKGTTLTVWLPLKPLYPARDTTPAAPPKHEGGAA